jgi:hypothetical protein
MAMKLNCIAAPDVVHDGNVQGTSSGSHRTPVHHGARSSTRTPSRSTARTASASAGRVVASGSRGRGKEIATPEPSDEDDGDSSSSSPAAASERVDPTYVSEIPMDVLFDAPPATQTQGESTSQVMNLKNFLLSRHLIIPCSYIVLCPIFAASPTSCEESPRPSSTWAH